jgi:pSer/pThr/pTyr-binding forkhead associated (FHA) protein
MPVFAHLYITEAGRPDRAVAVQDTATIGRDNENDIVLEAATVSRWHAVLLRDAAGLLLVDLESVNGTLVNGVLARPDEPVRLTDGDVIQLGEVVARYAAPPQRSIDVSIERLPDQAKPVVAHGNGRGADAHMTHAVNSWSSR